MAHGLTGLGEERMAWDIYSSFGCGDLTHGVAGYSNHADFMFGLPTSFVIIVLLFIAAKFFYH
jgi:hypothetical protein